MFFFLVLNLFYRSQNGQFQRNLSFFKVPEGVQHFPGGFHLFPGGSNCLFPIETHITCDFPGAGLENSTRPLVFTSASGCRASENFAISSENYFFPIYSNIFYVMQGKCLF